MVFVARTSSSTMWKTVASTVQTLVEEATFEASSEGLLFRAMDQSHVAMVDLSWSNSSFDRYECDKQFRFTVRVEDFVKLIKRAETKDSIEIAEAGDGSLLLTMQNGYRREFRIHLIESSAGSTPVPKLSFNTRIRLSHDVLQRILNDISVVSDYVLVRAQKDKAIFEGKSEGGSALITLDKGSADLQEFEVKEECSATYGIEYLMSISKAAGGTSDHAIFEFSSKMPLRLEFKLGESGGRIHFYLAPRIEQK